MIIKEIRDFLEAQDRVFASRDLLRKFPGSTPEEVETAIRQHVRTMKERIWYYMVENAGMLQSPPGVAAKLGVTVELVMAALSEMKEQLIIRRGVAEIVPRQILGRETSIIEFLTANPGIQFTYRDIEEIFYPEADRRWRIGTVKRAIRTMDAAGTLQRGSATVDGRSYVTYSYKGDTPLMRPERGRDAVIMFLTVNQGHMATLEQLSRWFGISASTARRAIAELSPIIFKQRRGRRMRYTTATPTRTTEYAYGIPIYKYVCQFHGTFVIENRNTGETRTFEFYDAQSPVGWSYDFDADRTGFNTIYGNEDWLDDVFSPLIHKHLNSVVISTDDLLGLNIPVLQDFDGDISLLDVCTLILGYTNWRVIELSEVGLGIEDTEITHRVLRGALDEHYDDEGVFALLMTNREMERNDFITDDAVRARLSGGDKSIYEAILIPYKHSLGDFKRYMFEHGLDGE